MGKVLWRIQDVAIGGRERARLRVKSLTVEAGITAILGPSGAGKTTLLNLLTGFEAPDKGQVHSGLNSVNGSLPLYWVPQTHGLWPRATALAHLRIVGCAPDRAQLLLDDFGLADVAAVRPGELSQGQRARLAVIRALASDAQVLVMDEPMACLDHVQGQRCWQKVLGHQCASDRSLVFSTHSPPWVLAMAERVVCLREGEVIYAGSVDELYHQPPDREAAECLGPVNWLMPKEATVWLDQTLDAPLSLRPEQLDVVPAPEGDLTVVQSVFEGAQTRTTVARQADDMRREFTHRTTVRLRQGAAVVLRIVSMLLLALCLSACQIERDADLPMRHVRTISLPPVEQMIPAPRGIEVGSDGHLYVIDTAGRILIFNPEGEVMHQWPMPESNVGKPEDLTLLKDGRLAVPDTHYHRVIVFNPDGTEQLRFGSKGRGAGEFIYPVSLAQDDRGRFYVCEYGGNDRVQVFSPEGDFLHQFGRFGTGPAEFQRPSGIVWHAGRVYISDAVNGRIQIFSDDGVHLGVLHRHGEPISLDFPYDLALDSGGMLWTPEWGSGRIRCLSLDGKTVAGFGTAGGGVDQFSTPWGVACGDDGTMYIADTGNRRIAEVDL